MLFGPVENALEKTTGLNLGSEVLGSPKFGASMIHSAVSPLKVAPAGGARTMLK